LPVNRSPKAGPVFELVANFECTPMLRSASIVGILIGESERGAGSRLCSLAPFLRLSEKSEVLDAEKELRFAFRFEIHGPLCV
jgi:hypothetical protein